MAFPHLMFSADRALFRDQIAAPTLCEPAVSIVVGKKPIRRGRHYGARAGRPVKEGPNSGEKAMRLLAICFCAAALDLSGCGKSEAPAETCVVPPPAAAADRGSYAGQRVLAHACMKAAAYAIARKGGSVAFVADAVFSQCAGKEADEIAALKKTGPVYPYQTAEIHEALVHQAMISAVQARAKGCGLPPGQKADSMLESKP
jgi:hypothetical protein